MDETKTCEPSTIESIISTATFRQLSLQASLSSVFMSPRQHDIALLSRLPGKTEVGNYCRDCSDNWEQAAPKYRVACQLTR